MYSLFSIIFLPLLSYLCYCRPLIELDLRSNLLFEFGTKDSIQVIKLRQCVFEFLILDFLSIWTGFKDHHI